MTGGKSGAGVPRTDTGAAVGAEKPPIALPDEPMKPERLFRSELTPAGEQYIIPGCEIDRAPATKQLNLF